MTEAEWDGCTDPQSMLNFLRNAGMLSERKARLFACAALRRLWDTLADERSRRAVEVSEQFADGLATAAQLAQARAEAKGPLLWAHRPPDLPWEALRATLEVANPNTALGAIYQVLKPEVWEAARAQGQGGVSLEPNTVSTAREAALGTNPVAERDARAQQAQLLRELFGPLPFRPGTSDRSLLRWHGGLVMHLVHAAYEEQLLPEGYFDPARLAVLADAVEEAGCSDPELLNHLRVAGGHVKGCWAVDAVLGRS
jgi:hypothetical protein